MLKKIVITTLLASIWGVNAFSYDAEMAKKFNAFYSNFTPKVLAKGTMEASADDLIKMIREGEKFTILDARTPGEMEIIGMKLPNTLEIPMDKVFKEENLKRLPTDEKLILLCHSGSRVTMMAAGLLMLGFNNIIILEGGIKAVAVAVGTDTVPIK
jgi:rhodanese-related sulfurtransferase